MNENLNNALRRLGEAAVDAARALGRMVCACADAVRASLAEVQALAKALKVQQALKAAPPRVRHLAYHSKKRRVQKKNINRALRDYERGR